MRVVPVEIQLHVFRIALADLDKHSEVVGRQRLLYDCSLVSHAWKDIAQPLLYRSVVLKPRGTGANARELAELAELRFFGTVTTKLALGACVISIEVSGATASNRLLQYLLFLPNIRHISGLVWEPRRDKLVVPPAQSRPALETLSVAGASDDAAWLVTEWFDLQHLRRFESTAKGVRLVLDEFMTCIPGSVHEFSFERFATADANALYTALAARQQFVTSLRWVPFWGAGAYLVQPPLYNPLAVLPAVRELNYCFHDPSFITLLPHAALEVLRVGTVTGSHDPWSARGQFELKNGGGYRDWHPLRRAVNTLCDVRATRFPALRVLGLCPLWSRPLAFDERECRDVPGMREMAQRVKTAGLKFVDELGNDWPEDDVAPPDSLAGRGVGGRGPGGPVATS